MDNLLLISENDEIFVNENEIKRDLSYWKGKLKGDFPELNLPFDFPRNNKTSFVTQTYNFTIPRHFTHGIKALIQQENVTSFVFFMSILKIVLYRYSSEEDSIVVTNINSNSCEMNTFVIRTQMQEDMTFRDVLHEVKTVFQEAYIHKSIPFTKVITEIAHENKTNRNPFFQVMMSMGVIEEDGLKRIDLLKERKVHSEDNLCPVDLHLKVAEEKGEYKCYLTYDTELYCEDTIFRMEGHLNKLIEGSILEPKTKIALLPLLTEQEKNKLIYEWNSREVEYPRHLSINELFEEQVELHPNDVALVFGNQVMTYRELDKRANQIASYLRKLNIIKEQLVAICLDRSIDLIASFLGVLKAGGAYVPIDLSYPTERIDYMLKDSNSAFIITNESIGQNLPALDSRVVYLDKEANEIASQSDKSIKSSGPENLAYVMYTSGSTGNPKGVAIVHRGIARLVKNIDYGNVGPEETYLNLAQVAFDLSAFEIYAPLLNGGKLVLVTTNKPTFEEISKTISQNKVTSLCITPNRLNLLLEDYYEYLGSLRQIFSAGEALPVWLAQKCLNKLKNCQLINLYGPTENSVTTTSYPVNENFHNSSIVLIGRPISSDNVYILDKFLQPVPIGVIGEIYMAGDGIAREYINKIDLTLERFPNDHFNNSHGRKLYKSGDLARYRSDGNIEFIRRADDQVKIRGYRIELGEIETIVGLHPSVRQSVAGTYKAMDGSTELVVYVVMNKDENFNQHQIRSYLRDRLPIHMIPTFFIELEEVPVTPVGKIDRKKLPSPTVSLNRDQVTLPRNPIETKLVSLWEKLLNYSPIGIRDNFFDLGGNSLLAMRLFSEIEKTFDKRLPVSTIFMEETIENLGKLISTDNNSEALSSALVAIQTLGSKPPLFCIHGEGGEVLIYRELATELGDNQPVYGLRYLNSENSKTITVEDLADRYIKEIKQLNPTGPYNLLGFCFGGVIAYEMAYRLIQDGLDVSLTIINIEKPGYQPSKISLSNLVINKLRRLHNMSMNERFSLLNQKIRRGMGLDKVIEVSKTVEEHTDILNQSSINDFSIKINKAISVYKPKPYPEKMLLIRGNNYDSYEDKLGWEHTDDGNIYVNRIFAPHDLILKKPHVEKVVKQIKYYLD